MALEETLDIVVTDDGMDGAIAKAEALERALDGARKAAEELDLAGAGAGEGLDGAIDPWRSIQPRVARGVGGRNDLPNLILLCEAGGCHAKAESRDDEQHRLGYWLRHNENPAEIPVWLVTEFSSRWVLLTEDGGYSESA